MMNISLIIFGFNEQDNIVGVFQSATEVLKTISSDYEIIIVNDGSTDKTGEMVQKLAGENPCIRVIHHEKNLGIGKALLSGYAIADKEYICAIPADGQFDINQLTAIKPFGNNVFYAFYRLDTRYGWYRQLLTCFNRIYNRYLLGVCLKDVNWIKVYKKQQLEMVKPQLSSSLVESEICAKLHKFGVKPIEVPSSYLQRRTGVPKGGGWKTLRKAIADVWKLYWVVYRFKPSE